MRAATLSIVLALVGVAHADRRGFDPRAIYAAPLGEASPSEGPADAPVTIIDWSDYACGYCNRVQPTMDRLARLYPGQLRFVHRIMPLDDDDTTAAEAALAAAAQGRFRPMHARLYGAYGRVDRTAVELVARELGLDMIRFRADLDAGTYRKKIADDAAAARALGVPGTPAFFINGRILRGNQPLRAFVAIVDEELARVTELRAHGQPVDYAALIAGGRTGPDATHDAGADADKLEATKLYKVGLGMPGHQHGRDDALVTIVVWSDFQCPYCQRQAPILARIRHKFGDDVRVVYRHFPVLFHRHSMIAAEAGAAAAEQGKFWPFHDCLFNRVDAVHHLARIDLERCAEDSGLDAARFRAALDERRFHDAVIAEGAAAEALGVDGTPTLFVNGHPISGLRDEATLAGIVDDELARAKEVVARGVPRAELYALLMTMAEGDDRADPSAVPSSTTIHVEPRAVDRGRAVIAACRRHDAARAGQLAGGLAGETRARVVATCAGEGVDLVP
jgi:protein-disulfide isomerase